MAEDKFRKFASEQMRDQGDQIRRWANDPTPGIAALCREIMAAAEAGAGKEKE